jgi:Endonuclease NucS
MQMYKVDIVNKTLIKLTPTSFSELNLKERFDIQEWLAGTPSILGEELLVIGKEFTLSSGKRLDILCVDKAGKLVIVELKRDDSGLSVEWQAIKYASYCSSLLDSEIFQLFASYLSTTTEEAKEKIEQFIDGDIASLNLSQRIILVSREFNPEVISAVLWLRDFNVDIQCTRLAPFLDEDKLFIKPEILIPLPEARDYIERKEVKQRLNIVGQAEWKGLWFVNVGEGPHRTWRDNVKFGHLSAGQGKIYSVALKRLSLGDKVYAYMAGRGYVGYGEVTSTAVPIRDFRHNGELLPRELITPRAYENVENDELCEYLVGISWFKTFLGTEAKTFPGAFANPNVVCRLRHEPTVEFVEKEFGISL